MVKLSGTGVAMSEQSSSKANKRALHFMLEAQRMMLEEIVFAGYATFDRARTEMHLSAEFASKMAGAHSVSDIRTLCEECGKHQIDFVRRDYDRVLKHGERMIETASNLFESQLRS
jgi:hypothetical protein